jgi:hypothetical protein
MRARLPAPCVEAYDDHEVIAMMRRLLLSSCLALSLAACATHPAAPAAGGNAVPAAVPAWQPPAAVASTQQTPIGCVGSTATRLPVAPGDCAGFGAVHSKTDLDRTGQPYLGPALQMIDPTVQAHGGP